MVGVVEVVEVVVGGGATVVVGGAGVVVVATGCGGTVVEITGGRAGGETLGGDSWAGPWALR